MPYLCGDSAENAFAAGTELVSHDVSIDVWSDASAAPCVPIED
jgi:hypothetical protein